LFLKFYWGKSTRIWNRVTFAISAQFFPLKLGIGTTLVDPFSVEVILPWYDFKAFYSDQKCSNLGWFQWFYCSRILVTQFLFKIVSPTYYFN